MGLGKIRFNCSQGYGRVIVQVGIDFARIPVAENTNNINDEINQKEERRRHAYPEEYHRLSSDFGGVNCIKVNHVIAAFLDAHLS